MTKLKYFDKIDFKSEVKMIGGLVLLFCRVVIIFIIGLFILTPLFKCLFKLSYKQFKVEKKDFAEFMKKESEEN